MKTKTRQTKQVRFEGYVSADFLLDIVKRVKKSKRQISIYQVEDGNKCAMFTDLVVSDGDRTLLIVTP